MSGDVHTLVRRFNAAPPGKLYCVHGGSEVFRLALNAVAVSLLRGVPVALVDGTNRFDIYAIARFARRLAARNGTATPTPEQLLARVFISRAFTCYQMEAVLTERLPRFLAGEDPRCRGVRSPGYVLRRAGAAVRGTGRTRPHPGIPAAAAAGEHRGAARIAGHGTGLRRPPRPLSPPRGGDGRGVPGLRHPTS